MCIKEASLAFSESVKVSPTFIMLFNKPVPLSLSFVFLLFKKVIFSKQGGRDESKTRRALSVRMFQTFN